jgi:hypothetical protein
LPRIAAIAAVVRDVHEHASRRRTAGRRQRVAEAQARRERVAADARTADLDAHPELRLRDGLDVLADTWLPDAAEFLAGGQLARLWLRRAVDAIFSIAPIGAIDLIEAHVRSWLAGRPTIPQPTCVAVCGVLRDLI